MFYKIVPRILNPDPWSSFGFTSFSWSLSPSSLDCSSDFSSSSELSDSGLAVAPPKSDPNHPGAGVGSCSFCLEASYF